MDLRWDLFNNINTIRQENIDTTLPKFFLNTVLTIV